MCRYPAPMAWFTAFSTSPGADCHVPAAKKVSPLNSTCYSASLDSVALNLPNPNAGISAPVLSLKRTSAAAVMIASVRLARETIYKVQSRQDSESTKTRRRVKE